MEAFGLQGLVRCKFRLLNLERRLIEGKWTLKASILVRQKNTGYTLIRLKNNMLHWTFIEVSWMIYMLNRCDANALYSIGLRTHCVVQFKNAIVTCIYFLQWFYVNINSHLKIIIMFFTDKNANKDCKMYQHIIILKRIRLKLKRLPSSNFVKTSYSAFWPFLFRYWNIEPNKQLIMNERI